MKKTRPGWEWVSIGTGGYWTKSSAAKHPHKLSLFCPHESCRRITGTIDNKYLLEYGICSICYVQYVESRKEPIIDIEYYKERYKERGY